MPLSSPKSIRRLAPVGAAVVAIVAVLTITSDAGASPTAECRNVSCAGAVTVGRAATWTSPQLFYPNNEQVFAAAAVGTTPLREVRIYGPALCRHRFIGAGTTVVIKACGTQTPLRVRALRHRSGSRSVRISYAARPLLDADSQASAGAGAPSIFDDLRQITGLLIG